MSTKFSSNVFFSKFQVSASSYPRFSTVVTVVDGDYKTWIFIQCSCLTALCVAIGIIIVNNQDAPSKHYKEGRRLVTKQLNSMWLLLHSHNMINHSLSALVWGQWT